MLFARFDSQQTIMSFRQLISLINFLHIFYSFIPNQTIFQCLISVTHHQMQRFWLYVHNEILLLAYLSPGVLYIFSFTLLTFFVLLDFLIALSVCFTFRTKFKT